MGPWTFPPRPLAAKARLRLRKRLRGKQERGGLRGRSPSEMRDISSTMRELLGQEMEQQQQEYEYGKIWCWTKRELLSFRRSTVELESTVERRMKK